MTAQKLKITILDHRLDRMHECELAVSQAIRELGLRAVVTQLSEPPYLSRLDVWERLPALEINGLIWSRKSKEAFTKSEIMRLLQKHYMVENGQGRSSQT